MQKFVYYPLILLLTLFASHAAAQPAPQKDSQKETNVIRKIIDEHYDVWNKHDVKQMAALYAPDGDLRTPWNEVGKNREEIEKIYASEQANQMKNAHIDKTVKSIRIVKPDIALVDVESTITGIKSGNAKQEPPFHHHVVFVLVKREGKWQILIGRPF